MRIAVISDVHGNVPALDAVLADLAKQAPDEVIVGGDLVGRGPEGSRVVAAIRARGWPCVRGNHEDYLLAFRRGNVPAPWLHTREWAASRWMAAELDAPAVSWIAALPDNVRSTLAPEVLVVHGSPRSNNEGLGAWSSDGFLEERLSEIDASVLVCAHTHRPMERRLGGGVVVNVGAVGLPFNRDRRAQYAILRRDGADWQIDFRQVEYDLAAILARYESTGFAAAGGITALLLRMELEQAGPFLVPFMRWVEATGRPAEESQLDAFLADYGLDRPMRAFLERLEAYRRGR
jgi:predicted phosphodiesterase